MTFLGYNWKSLTNQEEGKKPQLEWEERINRSQHQNDTDAGIIWQGFEHNHHKNATMTNYEHSETKEKIWHKETLNVLVLEKILKQKK